jgi:NTP pyrophosphatase (non-canonical NTP hydrolase)
MAAAIQAGGEVGRMAQRNLGLVMGRFLGIPADIALEGMGAPEANQLPEPTNSDFLPAPDEEIAEIEQLMLEAGFKERRSIDYRVREIFDVSLSQLTRRHARIMREYLEIGQAAQGNIKDKEEMAKFTQHLYQVMRLCYNTDQTIEEEIEQVWWDTAHGIVEEDNATETVNGHVEAMMSVPAPSEGDQSQSDEEDEPVSGEENEE